MKKDRINVVFWFLFMFGILFNTTEIMAQEWLQDNLAIQKVVADQITNGENQLDAVALTGKASGIVYNDLNQNRKIDAGEAGIPGVKITLYKIYAFWPLIRIVSVSSTNAAGSYQFSGLGLGTYILIEEDHANCTSTTINNKLFLLIEKRSLVNTVNFGDYCEDVPECTDGDQDNYAIEGGKCGEIDCDDTDFEVNPSITEIPYNNKDDDCNPDTTDTPGEAGGVCGPEGCSIEVTNPVSLIYGTKILIPPGALNEEIFISVRQTDVLITVPQDTYITGPAIFLEPDGQIFNSTIQVAMPYDDVDNNGILDYTGISEDEVSVIAYDTSNESWTGRNIVEQDHENNTVTFETNHFSMFVSSILYVCPRAEAYIYLIDGLKFVRTLFPFIDYDERSGYLYDGISAMNLGLDWCAIYSFGGTKRTSAWNGNAIETSEIMDDLLLDLYSKYSTAKDGGQKFIIVTHSWGTQLGTLALRYLGNVVKPDLFITLSDPSASKNANDYDNILFSWLPPVTVLTAHDMIENFISDRNQETFIQLGGAPSYDVDTKKWINYWDVGDVFSGPLDLNSLNANWEDRIVRGDTRRTVQTSIEVHSITSLSESVWENYGSVDEGQELRDRVEADITSVIRHNSVSISDDFTP